MKKRYLKWIDKNIDCSQLINKTILITGGNSGIGLTVAKYCAYLKMNIIITSRTKEKAGKAIKEIKQEFPECNIQFLLLDTSSIESIKSFANQIINNNIDLDIFYSNAGTFNLPKQLTNDGYEQVIMTNYLGPYLIFKLLDDYFLSLNHPIKLILTTSITAKRTKLNYDDFNSISSTTKFNTYAESKLANVHLYLYLKEKYQNSNVTAMLVHPGVTATPLIFKAYPKWFANIALFFMKIVFHSVDKAALSTIYLLNENNSMFVGPRGIGNISGYPNVNKISTRMSKNYTKTIQISENLLLNKI